MNTVAHSGMQAARFEQAKGPPGGAPGEGVEGEGEGGEERHVLLGEGAAGECSRPSPQPSPKGRGSIAPCYTQCLWLRPALRALTSLREVSLRRKH